MKKNIVKNKQQLYLLFIEDNLNDLKRILNKHPKKLSIEQIQKIMTLPMKRIYK